VAVEDVSAATVARIEAVLGGLSDALEAGAASEAVAAQTAGRLCWRRWLYNRMYNRVRQARSCCPAPT
jgi:hypothetical protein